MKRLLALKAIRELIKNFPKYLALMVMIAASMFMIVGLCAAADTVIMGVQELEEKDNFESGEIVTNSPIGEYKLDIIESMEVVMEKQSYADYSMEDGSSLRLYRVREKINLIEPDSGSLPLGTDELVLEKRYAKVHGLNVGNQIMIGGTQFTISGIGTTGDYDAVLDKMSDPTVDSNAFGTAFVTSEAYEMLLDGEKNETDEVVSYAYKLKEGVSDTDFIDIVRDILGDNFVAGIKAADNARMYASYNNMLLNRAAGLAAGIIVIMLFNYVTSVFVIHSIEQESQIIGVFYALGVRRRELMSHYLMIPVLVTFLGGILGAVLGFSDFGVSFQLGNIYGYFSIPQLEIQHTPYLMAYALLMPPICCGIIIYLIIRSRLNRTALSLIRNEDSSRQIREIDLGNMGFVERFSIRQILREMRSVFAVLAGLFICLIVLMLGINTYAVCKNMKANYERYIRFEYMYMYANSDAKDDGVWSSMSGNNEMDHIAPEDGYEGYVKTFKSGVLGYEFDVNLLGITQDNPFFDVDTTGLKKDVVISSALATKFNLKTGDYIVISDDSSGRSYAFEIADVTTYSAGFYAFMNIDEMREYFDASDDFYNVVISTKELDIDSDELLSTTTRSALIDGTDVFTELMMPMLIMILTLSAVIFAIVMFLMIKVMVDRSVLSISLFKIFGYRKNEIRKLFLNFNFYIIAAGALICIPLAKAVMDGAFPYIMASTAAGLDTHIGIDIYAAIYVAVIAVYLLISTLLNRRLNSISPAEVLKNRE